MRRLIVGQNSRSLLRRTLTRMEGKRLGNSRNYSTCKLSVMTAVVAVVVAVVVVVKVVVVVVVVCVCV